MKKAFDYAEKISETPGCEDVCMEMNSENFVELSFNEDGLHKTEEIDSFFQFEKSTYDSDTEELVL